MPPSYDQSFWERLWAKTLKEHGDKVSQRPPNARLIEEARRHPPGRALDAGCGHGGESLWLAAHGWQVTGVDFSAEALAHARRTAETAGEDIAARLDWVEGDLTRWAPSPGRYDLVACLYVHIPGAVEELVQRMASGVARGGVLLMVGHQPIDPDTGAPTAAAGQVQVSVEAALDALESAHWEILQAEDLPRRSGGVDAVIRAERL